MEWFVTTDADLQSMFGDMRELHRTRKLRKVKAVGGKRSLNQNDLSHAWFAQMAREDKQDDELGHRCYCKLHHGVPILRAEDEDFRAFYDAVLKPRTYEQRREAMKYFPVTSLMTKEQLSKFLEAVQKDYWENRRIKLEFPQ